MTGRKIDLSVYMIEGTDQMVDPQKVLAELVMAPLLQLAGRELLEHWELRKKILASETRALVLDKPDYNRLSLVADLPKRGGATIGWGLAEVEMIRRILEAPEVEVTEKGQTA